MSLQSLLDADRRFMGLALREAERAYDEQEVPVGAVVVRQGEVLGKGRNMVERLQDPTAHAEIIAITAACQTLGSKLLKGCTLYVTLEPCPMCAGAIVWARLDRIVFGAFDEKAGSASTLYNIPQDRRLNHYVEVVSGMESDRAAALIRGFFTERRRNGGADAKT
jgi:tRNA(adenine34) deaminase